MRDLIGLHVNGSAELMAPDEFAHRYPADQVDIVRGRRAERWIVVTVEEAYIHCSKHIPKLQPVPRTATGGRTTREKKGGDYFRVAAERRRGGHQHRRPGLSRSLGPSALTPPGCVGG